MQSEAGAEQVAALAVTAHNHWQQTRFGSRTRDHGRVFPSQIQNVLSFTLAAAVE